jgi:hypothetical protein
MRGTLTISKTLSEVPGELDEGGPKTDAGKRTQRVHTRADPSEHVGGEP